MNGQQSRFTFGSAQVFGSISWICSWDSLGLAIFAARVVTVPIAVFVCYLNFSTFFSVLVLIEGQSWHTAFFISSHALCPTFWTFFSIRLPLFFLTFFLKIAVGQFDIFHYFFNRSATFLPTASPRFQLALISHLSPYELVLQISDVLLVILNYFRDVLLKYSGELLMILVVLAE